MGIGSFENISRQYKIEATMMTTDFSSSYFITSLKLLAMKTLLQKHLQFFPITNIPFHMKTAVGGLFI